MPSHGYLRVVFGLGLWLSILSCTTTSQQAELNYPLATIQATIHGNLTMGIESMSENKREIISRPFVVTQNPHALVKNLRERGRARIFISGNEMPYTIEVDVTIERGRGNDFQFDRHDLGLARKLLSRIQQGLEHSDRNKNIIDDFRAF